MAANKKLSVFNDNGVIVKEAIVSQEEYDKFLTKVAEMEFPPQHDDTRLPYEEYLIEDVTGKIHTIKVTPFTWSKAEEVQ